MILTIAALLVPLAEPIVPGPWRATLASPAGELPFTLVVDARANGLYAVIANGDESIERPLQVTKDGAVRIEFPHYDSVITAQLGDDGRSLVGTWAKIVGLGRQQEMVFAAHADQRARFPIVADAPVLPDTVSGRWRMRFEGEDEDAVLILRAQDSRVVGTVLTQTGDHRYLEGVFQVGRLRLSCFDGAHAFLYDAQLREDGALVGTFASGARWQQAWSAVRAEDAALGDDFARARWATEPGLLWIEGVDLAGGTHALGEYLFDASALLVQIVGSWCPNCHDESAWLAPIARDLELDGLRTVTLGFELTGDAERDLRQLERMRARHGADHVFLLAGTADKSRTAAALGAIDRVVAFPTLVILSGDGTPRAVHTGFRGPATGADHASTTSDLQARIESAIAEPRQPSLALEAFVAEGLWRNERDRTLVEVRREGDRVAFVERELFRFDGPTREEPVAVGFVEARGDVLKLGEDLWQFDRRAEVALDPRDLGHRLNPATRGPFPRVGDGKARGVSTDRPEELLAGLNSTDAVVRREAVWFLTHQIVTAMFSPPDYAPDVDAASAAQLVPRLEDPDPLVRATACWAVGVLRVEGGVEALRANTTHPFPAVRREATRALAAFEKR